MIPNYSNDSTWFALYWIFDKIVCDVRSAWASFVDLKYSVPYGSSLQYLLQVLYLPSQHLARFTKHSQNSTGLLVVICAISIAV
jgi:hypothetical protein